MMRALRVLLALVCALAALAGAAAFSPRAFNSAHSAAASSMVAPASGPAAAAAAAAAARRAHTSAALRDITMRLASEPPRATAWTAPVRAAGAMPLIEKKRSSSGGGAAVLERPAQPLVAPRVEEEQPNPEDKFKVMLFNDNGNTREYVARCLVQIIGMSESDAFSCMTMAHKNGMALVGIWHLELAEGYCDQLKSRGLISEIFPVDASE